MEEKDLKTINEIKHDKRKNSSKSNIQKALEKRKQILEEKRKNDGLVNIKFNENYAISDSSTDDEEFVKKNKKKHEKEKPNIEDIIKREMGGMMDMLKQHEAKLDKLNYKYKKQKEVVKTNQVTYQPKVDKNESNDDVLRRLLAGKALR